MMIQYDRLGTPAWCRSFCPNVFADSICDVAPEFLLSQGIKAVGLDLDNTLTPWKSYELGEGIEAWLESVRSVGIKTVLVSNSRRKKRLVAVSERWNIPYVVGPMKPRRAKFLAALALLNVSPREFAMFGDQMFTDIWGGNRINCFTVWVAPMNEHEFFGTRWTRGLEQFYKRCFKPMANEQQ